MNVCFASAPGRIRLDATFKEPLLQILEELLEQLPERSSPAGGGERVALVGRAIACWA